MIAVDVARSVIAKLDADERIDWDAEAAEAGLSIYELQSMIRYLARVAQPADG